VTDPMRQRLSGARCRALLRDPFRRLAQQPGEALGQRPPLCTRTPDVPGLWPGVPMSTFWLCCPPWRGRSDPTTTSSCSLSPNTPHGSCGTLASGLRRWKALTPLRLTYTLEEDVERVVVAAAHRWRDVRRRGRPAVWARAPGQSITAARAASGAVEVRRMVGPCCYERADAAHRSHGS
jgi:hypothetical protein